MASINVTPVSIEKIIDAVKEYKTHPSHHYQNWAINGKDAVQITVSFDNSGHSGESCMITKDEFLQLFEDKKLIDIFR